VLVGGLVFAAVGFALLLLVDSRIDPQVGLAAMIAGTVVMSLGMAPVFTLGNEMIITAAPPERAGAASAISETSSEFSGALGIALFGSVGTAIYGTRLADSMPDGIAPEGSAEAIATLGGAVAASRSLPAPLESALLDASRGAFVDAMQGAALAAIVIMIGASWIAARILRKR
jgi:DHA2 family multidrug resistance protein-like MFS transporter